MDCRSRPLRLQIARPMAQFIHHDLRLLDPAFSSPLLDVLTDLEHLRPEAMQAAAEVLH